MKLKIDLREKRLIKLIQAFKNQFDFKKIDIEIENLPVGDVIICDDNGNEKLIVERKSLNELIEKLEGMGLKFGMDITPYIDTEAAESESDETQS